MVKNTASPGYMAMATGHIAIRSMELKEKMLKHHYMYNGMARRFYQKIKENSVWLFLPWVILKY